MIKIDRGLNSIITQEEVKGNFKTILKEITINESLANEAYATGLEYVMPGGYELIQQLINDGFNQSKENTLSYTKILNTTPELKAIIYQEKQQLKLIIRDSFDLTKHLTSHL